MSDHETHEQRSCLRKVRYEKEPSEQLQGDYFYAYECSYCKGWHLATSKHRKNGDMRFTKEGWPIADISPCDMYAESWYF